jgi:hypothetical protein
MMCLIAEMIGLAKKTGDVTRVPISLPAMTFEQANFWTSHFGGLYVFRDVKFPAAISTVAGGKVWARCPSAPVMDLSQPQPDCRMAGPQRAGRTHRAGARDMDAAAVLRQKMDFILVEAADANWGSMLATRGGPSCARSPIVWAPACPRNSMGWPRCCAGWKGRGLAADHIGTSGVFLHPAGGGGARPRSGEHAVVRTGADGRAADVHHA